MRRTTMAEQRRAVSRRKQQQQLIPSSSSLSPSLQDLSYTQHRSSASRCVRGQTDLCSTGLLSKLVLYLLTQNSHCLADSLKMLVHCNRPLSSLKKHQAVTQRLPMLSYMLPSPMHQHKAGSSRTTIPSKRQLSGVRQH